MNKPILVASIQHTGTWFVLDFLRSHSKVGGFMELSSFSFQRDPIMVVHTHFGEGPTVHPDDSKKFVGFNALLDLSSDFPIVVPLVIHPPALSCPRG